MRLGTSIFALLMGVTQPITPAAATEPAPCTSDAMIVFDASGSMAASDFKDGAPSRIDRTRQAIGRVLPRVSKVRNLGLVVYGPGKNSNACRNISLRFGPLPDAGARVMDEIDRLAPGGRTPITRSMQVAVEALNQSPRPATVVLLTDGQETCNADPCTLARQLPVSNPGVTVHVVGYKLQSLSGNPPRSGAECLAEATGGTSTNAETIDELADALSKSLECPQVSAVSPAAPRGDLISRLNQRRN